MSELKPCPFCGGEARTFRSLSTEEVYVICDSDECMACGPIKDAEDTAACAWNTRPDSLALTAAEDDAQRLRELVCAEDLGDFVKMSGKRPHEIGRYLIDLWQEDIQGREREKALALSAAVQGEREACARIVEKDYLKDAFHEKDGPNYVAMTVRARIAKKIRSISSSPKAATDTQDGGAKG